MNIWLTTDTHFNHDKMLEYCDRPENFEELISKGLSAIPKEDVLIHLGDICIGNDAEVHEKYIKPLKCKKWLIKGNHDNKSNKFYIENGWDYVGYSFRDKFFGKKILFSHQPQENGDVDLNIHGHFHNQLPRLLKEDWVVPDEKYRNEHDMSLLNEKHKLLALEYTEYKPVSLKSFIS